jgi:Ca2+-binding EF-hand superfamily protein
MKNIVLLLTGALLTLSFPVVATDAPAQAVPPQAAPQAAPRVHNMLKRFDIDKDGRVSREEFAANRAKGFAKFDTDKNDVLSLEEFKARCKNERCIQMKTKQFAKLDKDGDGSVTKSEFVGIIKMFDRIDRNKDGYLTEDELPGRNRNRAERDMRKEGAPPTMDGEMMKQPAK